MLKAKSSKATTTQPHVQRKRLGSAQTLGLAPTRSTYLRRPLRRPRLGLSTMLEHPHPLSLSPCCDSQHHTADSNKARSVRHDAAGHMGKLGRRTPPQDGLMEAASLWRGGDSHRSGPVVLPTQQISDLKRSGKQETQPATTAQCFSPGNDRGSTKHSSVPPWHDAERTCSPRTPQGLRSAGGAAARSLELFAAILRGVNGGLNATPVPTGAPRPTVSTRAACL